MLKQEQSSTITHLQDKTLEAKPYPTCNHHSLPSVSPPRGWMRCAPTPPYPPQAWPWDTYHCHAYNLPHLKAMHLCMYCTKNPFVKSMWSHSTFFKNTFNNK